MKIASTLSVAFLAGLSVAMWTSLASAQQTEEQQPAGWAAAAAQCRGQVGSQRPLHNVGVRSGVNIRPPENPRV
jgi:hypothetical protein